METRLFSVRPDRCTACRNCELACAMAHSGGWARIRAVSDPSGQPNRNTVVVCLQCDQAACVAACPAKALVRNPDTGAIEHLPERCIRCASCVAACPFGNMRWDARLAAPFKCDLCRGDPVCVRFCPTAAIEYVAIQERGETPGQ